MAADAREVECSAAARGAAAPRSLASKGQGPEFASRPPSATAWRAAGRQDDRKGAATGGALRLGECSVERQASLDIHASGVSGHTPPPWLSQPAARALARPRPAVQPQQRLSSLTRSWPLPKQRLRVRGRGVPHRNVWPFCQRDPDAKLGPPLSRGRQAGELL